MSPATWALRQVNIIFGKLEHLDIKEFRRRAFLPQLPLLITTSAAAANTSDIPATVKWFSVQPTMSNDTPQKYRYTLRRSYLEPYGDTVLPYELFVPQIGCSDGEHVSKDAEHPEFIHPKSAAQILGLVGGNFSSAFPGGSTFHKFHAPLDLLLLASRSLQADVKDVGLPVNSTSQTPQLYVAQAQVSELPQQLQDDLPAPKVVREAGRGDIYDANIWLGIPPTYTPLHKDPNPNLFVQLASEKVVRIFSPEVGSEIFRRVQQKTGGDGSFAIRGDEMMQGPERGFLENAVWDHPDAIEGYEVVVRPGDGLFIPKGWWHSIRSIGVDINASVSTAWNSCCLSMF
jgi:hypothetical protein